MNIISLCGVGLICVCAVIIVRENGYGSFSTVIACICTALMIIYAVDHVSSAYGEVKALLYNDSGVRHVDLVIKAFGVAFVCEICSDFIKELGSDGIARGLETAGKAEILFMCISPMKEIMTSALSLIGQA